MFLHLLVIVSLSLNIAVNGQIIDYNKCPKVVEETKVCIDKYPVNGITDSDSAASVLNFISSNSTLCSSKDQYISLLKCVYAAFVKCIREDLRGLSATEENYRSSLDYFCENIQDFTFSCVASLLSGSSYLDCLKKNGPSQPSNTEYATLKEYICKTADVSIDCISKSPADERCVSTKKILLELSKRETPPTCGTNGMTAGVLLVLLSSLLSVMRYF